MLLLFGLCCVVSCDILLRTVPCCNELFSVALLCVVGLILRNISSWRTEITALLVCPTAIVSIICRLANKSRQVNQKSCHSVFSGFPHSLNIPKLRVINVATMFVAAFYIANNFKESHERQDNTESSGIRFITHPLINTIINLKLYK